MEIINDINKFRDDRNWRQFHNSKDLALALSVEASELLEIFLWKGSKEAEEKSMEHIKEEIADILIYAYMLSDDLGLDINEIIKEKLIKNEIKYPFEKNQENSK